MFVLRWEKVYIIIFAGIYDVFDVYIYSIYSIFMSLQIWKYAQNLFDWGSLELHTTKSRHFNFLTSCEILGKNHQFFRIENFDEIFSFWSNSRVNHRIYILSYVIPKSTIRMDFVHSFTFLNPEVRQKHLHISNTLYIRKNYDINFLSFCFFVS